MPHQRRARPLSPAARRQAILAAVIPLLEERGGSVTTRQMAEAAGVAEGTIFRVFPHKRGLLAAAFKAIVDPSPVERDLALIYEGAPIEVQLEEAARIVRDYFARVFALFTAIRSLPPERGRRTAGPPRFVKDANAAIDRSLTLMFGRFQDQLRIEPGKAAVAFRGLVLAGTHPAFSASDRLTVDEVVSVLVSGVTRPEMAGEVA
ncbi:MAG TPA: helix-turn-helix domain-containing protein [Acidimicrobiia bacterium]|jgi:AcrR family transcriptional regulator